MSRVIAIASGKGGTGKTTTAINLSVSLNDLGKTIVLCDTNFNSPHVCLHLGVETPKICLNEVLFSKRNISDAIYIHPSGLKFIPNSGAYITNNSFVSFLPNMISSLAGDYEIVILDVGAVFNKAKVYALKSADEVIVVTTPDLPALVEAKRVIRNAEALGSRVIGVILNKVKKRFGVPLDDITRYMKKTIIGLVPDDVYITKSLFLQHPVMYIEPSSPSAKEFRRLAEMIAV